MMAALWESRKEGFEWRDTERGRLESLGLHKILKEINKNMAKKDYTAQDVNGLIFDEIWEEAERDSFTCGVCMCLCVRACICLHTCRPFLASGSKGSIWE